jgi:hypothetical protein
MESASLSARFLLAAAVTLASVTTVAVPSCAQRQEVPKTTFESIGTILSYTKD